MNTTTRLSRQLSLAAAAVLVAACSADDVGPELGDAATTNMDAGHHTPDTGPPDTNVADTGTNVVDTGASTLDTSPEAVCMRAGEAFESFLSQHQNCQHDTDCAIIGDCSPNADFRSINASYADQGYELMRARCAGASDGPVYSPRCVAGRCGKEGVQDPHVCCGCGPLPEVDAGHEDDAGR